MFYVQIAAVVAFVTAAMTEEFPQVRTHIGFISIALAVIGVAIGVTTGNVATSYDGAALLFDGLLMVFARMVAAARDGDRSLPGQVIDPPVSSAAAERRSPRMFSGAWRDGFGLNSVSSDRELSRGLGLIA
jgi:hypothetical protein